MRTLVLAYISSVQNFLQILWEGQNHVTQYKWIVAENLLRMGKVQSHMAALTLANT